VFYVVAMVALALLVLPLAIQTRRRATRDPSLASDLARTSYRAERRWLWYVAVPLGVGLAIYGIATGKVIPGLLLGGAWVAIQWLRVADARRTARRTGVEV
jgi:hypothetical protein